MRLVDDRVISDELATTRGLVEGLLVSTGLWAIMIFCLWAIFIWAIF
jgi:hypothetical protein